MKDIHYLDFPISFFLPFNRLHIEFFSGTLLFLYNIPLLHFSIIFLNNRTDLGQGVSYRIMAEFLLGACLLYVLYSGGTNAMVLKN